MLTMKLKSYNRLPRKYTNILLIPMGAYIQLVMTSLHRNMMQYLSHMSSRPIN